MQSGCHWYNPMARSCMRPAWVNYCQWSVMQLGPYKSSLSGIVCMSFAFSFSLAWRWLQCECCIDWVFVDASVEQGRDHPLSFHRDKDNWGHSWGLSAAGVIFIFYFLQHFTIVAKSQSCWKSIRTCKFVFCFLHLMTKRSLTLHPVFPHRAHNGSAVASSPAWIAPRWLTAGCPTAPVLPHPCRHESQ